MQLFALHLRTGQELRLELNRFGRENELRWQFAASGILMQLPHSS